MAEEKVRIKGRTAISDVGGLTCIGEVCFKPDGHIEIEVGKSDCPPAVIEELVKRTMKGVEVQFVLTRPKPEEKK